MQPGAEVQPHRAGHMTRLQHTDLLALLDRVAGRHERLNRLDARHQTAAVLDREHRAPGHRPREAHDAVLRGEHGGSGRRGDVDAAMPGPIGRRWRIEGTDNLVGTDRPRPGGETEQQQGDEDAHAGMVHPTGRRACGRHSDRWRARLRHDPPGM